MLSARPLTEPPPPLPKPGPFECRHCGRVVGTRVGGWVISTHQGREWQIPPGGRVKCEKCRQYTTVTEDRH